MLIGIDRVVAYGDADLRREWSRARGGLQTVSRLDIKELSTDGGSLIVDVRGGAEWSEGHVPHAEHHFLGDLVASMQNVARDKPVALYCQGGTRAAIGASLLRAQGFTNVATVPGGMTAWAAAGLPVETGDPVAP
jgi:hydroxyacylglutathione hydrolase